MLKLHVRSSAAILAVLMCLLAASCNKTPEQSGVQEPNSDPAQANLAAPEAAQGQETQYAAPPQQQTPNQRVQRSYREEPSTQASYPPLSGSTDQNYRQDDDYNTYDNDSAEPAVEAEQAPPPLPQYSQPECPGENYIWTPGNWAYASAGYYWVPGAWVVAPFVGALWTPPYWAYDNGRYRWYHGYWGHHVGYYGGIDYRYGYVGRGYEGGYWNHNQFAYNRTVNNVNTTIVHNVYNYRVTNITNVNVSYVGGRGGLNARPTPAELAVLHEPRIAPLPTQVQHMRQAESNRGQFAAVNHDHPAALVAARPLATEYKAPAPRPQEVPGARSLPPVNRPRPAAPPPPPPAQRAEMPPAHPGQAPMRDERPEGRPAPAVRPPAAPPQRPELAPHPEVRPTPPNNMERPQKPYAPAPHTPAPPMNRPPTEPHPEARPAPPPHIEQRPVPEPRIQERPAPQARPEQHNEPKPPTEPRPEARPVPPPHMEQRPAPEPRIQERPAPQARPEQHSEAKPPAKPEERKPPEKEREPHP